MKLSPTNPYNRIIEFTRLDSGPDLNEKLFYCYTFLLVSFNPAF